MTGIEAVQRALGGRGDVRLAYVFGSVAGGRARVTSDLDLALLFTTPPVPAALDRLADELSGVAGRSVDLVDLASAPPLLAHQVISKGTCIAQRSPGDRATFEARTVLRYLDTKHLRSIQHRYLRLRAKAHHDGRA